MKKIGVFLGWGPEQPITNQGIGRLLAFIIKGLLDDPKITVVLATPYWYKKKLYALLNDHQINKNRIEFITTSKNPIWLRLKKIIYKFKFLFSDKEIKRSDEIKKSKFIKYINSSKELINKWIIAWLGCSSITLFFLGAIIMLGGIIVILPFIFIKFISSKLKNYIFRKGATALLSRKYDWFEGVILINIINKLKFRLHSHELNKLVKNINKRDDLQLWFVPAAFWPEVEKIKVKKITAVPDIVMIDFPTRFVNYISEKLIKNISKLVLASDHLLCYSEYVKQKHLMEFSGCDAKKISVIQQGSVDLSKYLDDLNESGINSRREYALQIINKYQEEFLNNDPYLHNYNFSSMQYIFYSSQIRGQKNYLNLIKAYEILLRRRFINIKLIVTGNFKDDFQIKSYIKAKRLQYDVISLHDVSNKVLAALNHLAVCAVNPSLFEGGFPFTFAEAFSVGTPSIMSSIPVVLEKIKENNLKEMMLFDPYNLEDMVNKIEWGVKNREALYQLQLPFYQEMSKRTWTCVANEYVSLFKKIAIDT